MKIKSVLWFVVPILMFTGCTITHNPSHATGRYQTVVSSDIAIMTDTTTGQAWSTPIQEGRLVSKDILESKTD